jgi:aerobic carbon-monoxide dehydrogenase large subunit
VGVQGDHRGERVGRDHFSHRQRHRQEGAVRLGRAIASGQVHGGIAQGLGQAMLESCVYESESGQLLTGSQMDYTMPRPDDLPDFDVDHTVTARTHNPLGIKGCGEAGAIGSPAAFINALTDALGVRDIAMPATTERVWRVAKEIA